MKKTSARNAFTGTINRIKRGDLLVHVTVVVPRKLSRNAKKLVEQLGEELGDDVSKERARLSR